MNKTIFINRIASLVFTIIFVLPLFAQDKFVRFSLDDVIRIAKEQSPDAILARHRFRSSYWQYRSFKASYLPGIILSGTMPDLNRSIEWNSSTNQIITSNSLTNYGSLSLSQNIGLTGGSISISSELQRIDQLDSTGLVQYLSTPISITFRQPLFAYNSMKWERKIQPMVFDEAKKNYIVAIEQVNLTAIGRFFDLAAAQLNLRVAQINYSNSDTLYKIAQGRYNIGTIAENDLLQMQLSYLNAKTDLNKAEIDLEMQKSKLRSFLGYNEKMNFELILPSNISALQLEYQRILDWALKNNPNVIARKRQIIEASRDVAQAKGERRSIDLFASYGLNHSEAADIPLVYKEPFNDREQVRVGISVPIIDWGKSLGRVKMAQSNLELVKVQVQQNEIDFEQNIFLQVMQFNLQNDQVMIAAKADTIGQKRYDVTKQRFLIGKIDVLNLNDALREKDSAKRGYIDALRNYWNYYYTIRQLTLFDFLKNQAIQEDLDNLIQ